MKRYGDFVYILFLSGLLSVLSCFSEGTGTGLGPLEDGYTRVTIVTGRDAAPSGVTQINLTISASDMTDIVTTVPIATGTLTVDVPSGSARVFSATASSPTTAYSGFSTQDLVEGATIGVDITMARTSVSVAVTPSWLTGSAPSNITTYNLTITGAGMATINDPNYTLGNPIPVPAGTGRTITLVADGGVSDTSSALEFTGTVTSDTDADGTIGVTAQMIVSKTAIIFPHPDVWTPNPKLVKLDALNATPAEVIYSDVSSLIAGGISTFAPWDIDYDAQGRIYFANFSNNPYDFIVRIDSFTTLNLTQISQPGSTGIVALAIDKVNNILYFTRGTDLIKIDLINDTLPAAGTSVPITAFTTPTFTSMAVDDQGYLYLADSGETVVTNQSVPDKVVKFDPNNDTILNTYATDIDFLVQTGGGPQNLSDIMIRGTSVYVANYDGIDGNRIVELNASLQFFTGYGTVVNIPDTTTKGAFYGVHYFAGIRNDKFYMIDENFDGTNFNNIDKLVSMDDMSGTNWTVDTTNTFDFFYYC